MNKDNNIIAEKQTIGSILNDAMALEKIPHIEPNHFSLKLHNQAWDILLKMPQPDLLGLMVELANKGIRVNADGYKGQDYFTHCGTLALSGINVEGHAADVYKFYVKRYIFKQSELLRELTDNISSTTKMGDVFSQVEKIHAKIDLLQQPIGNGGPKLAEDIIKNELIPSVEARRNGTLKLISTGLRQLDDALYGGLVGGSVYLVGASSGIGKTELSSTLAVSALSQGLFVVIFSLEAKGSSAVQRVIQMAKNIDIKAFMLPQDLSDDDYNKLMLDMREAKLNLMVDDTTGISPSKVRLEIRKLDMIGKKPDLVIIDYAGLQSVDGSIGGGLAKSDYIHSKNKQTAMEFNIPFISLEQFKKGMTRRKPQKGHFMYSSINHCDVGFGLWRPDIQSNEVMRVGEVDIYFLKNRQSQHEGLACTVDRNINSGLYINRVGPIRNTGAIE